METEAGSSSSASEAGCPNEGMWAGTVDSLNSLSVMSSLSTSDDVAVAVCDSA